MKTLMYTSRKFVDDASALIDEEEEFMIIVQKNEKIKNILEEELLLLSGKKVRANAFVSTLKTLRLIKFYTGVSDAIADENYEIRYENKGDLLIYFTPIKNK